MLTEMRRYVGEPGTIAFDGFSGFVIGQEYQLRFQWLAVDMVAVYLDHLHCGELLGPVQLYRWDFERWWVKSPAAGGNGGGI